MDEHMPAAKADGRVTRPRVWQLATHLGVEPLARGEHEHVHLALTERALRVVAREEEEAAAADERGGVVGAGEGRLAHDCHPRPE